MTKNDTLVNLFGYFYGSTGYNIHTKNFFKEMKKKIDILKSDLQIQESIEKNFIFLKTKARNLNVANIELNIGKNIEHLFMFPGKKIGYTVWETNKIPVEWKDNLDRLDEIWTATKWGKDIFIKNGYDEKKIKVIPEGVDTNIFSPDTTPFSELKNVPGFKFLNVGKYEDRKSTKELILAFDKEFEKTEGVYLVLSCHNNLIKDFNMNNILMSLKLKCPEKFIIIQPLEKHEELAKLYTSCDAAVFPTKGEGWGLPIIESLASGLPTIVTNYSGQTEYITNENSYLLDYKLEKIKNPFYSTDDNDFGEWAIPNIEHLKELMREIFNNRDEAKKKGLFASQDMKKNWSWENSASIAIKEIFK